jgi:hypothetical protein
MFEHLDLVWSQKLSAARLPARCFALSIWLRTEATAQTSFDQDAA